MRLYRVILKPLSPFHAGIEGRARKSGAVVHSDTLHAALMDVAAVHGSALLDRAETLRVSSLFPCWDHIYTYPRPFLPLPVHESAPTDPTGRKRWKSVRLVSERVLDGWLRGDRGLHGRAHIHHGSIALDPADLSPGAPPMPVVQEELRAAVTVDRRAAGTVPFQRRALRVNAAAGVRVWFAAELRPEEAPEFQRMLEILGQQGLGGERSVGYGQFEVDSVMPAEGMGQLVNPGQSSMWMALGLYLPTREDVKRGVLRTPAVYDCTIRGGWIHDAGGSEHRRRALRMCLEGSVFPNVGRAPAGEVRDCAPAAFRKHPVWRSGLALLVPFTPVQGDAS